MGSPSLSLMRIVASAAAMDSGSDRVDQRVIESALEQLSPEAAADLRPRVRARWLRTIKAARELVSSNADSEALELEAGGETASFQLSKRLLKHCSRDVIEACQQCLSDVMAEPLLAPEHMRAILLVGGASKLPGVVEQLQKAATKLGLPDSLPILQPADPGQCVALGAATLAARHHRSLEGLLLPPERCVPMRGGGGAAGGSGGGRLPEGLRGKHLSVVVTLSSLHGDHVALVTTPTAVFPSKAATTRLQLSRPPGDSDQRSAEMHFAMLQEGSNRALCDLGSFSLAEIAPLPTTAGGDPDDSLSLTVRLHVQAAGGDPAVAVARLTVCVIHAASKTLWRGEKSGVLVVPG